MTPSEQLILKTYRDLDPPRRMSGVTRDFYRRVTGKRCGVTPERVKEVIENAKVSRA